MKGLAFPELAGLALVVTWSSLGLCWVLSEEILPGGNIWPWGRADTRKLQVTRLKLLSIKESHSLKLPFPSTRLLLQLFLTHRLSSVQLLSHV